MRSFLESRAQELSNGIQHARYSAQYRHVIYRWKALELFLDSEKRGWARIGSALLLENLRYVFATMLLWPTLSVDC